MPTPTALLIFETRTALGMSQGEFGDLIGIVKRTVQRWEAGGTILLPGNIETMARAVHPRDPELAARIAAHGGTTLQALGLEKPRAPPPSPPAPPGAPPPLSPLPTVTLVDSIVCVAADAIGVLPRAIRPALAAAFVRAREVRLDVGAVADSLTGDAPKESKAPSSTLAID